MSSSTMFACLIISAATLAAQPRFSAASVKPCNAATPDTQGGRGAGGAARAVPARLELPCQSLRMLIQVAYIRSNFRATGVILQLEGAPDWMSSEQYRITAVAD